MAKQRQVQPRLKNVALRAAISTALASVLILPATARAFEFSLADGEVKGSFDTTLSYGALWRASGRSPDNIGAANGGTARSVNEDDGNLNYGRGDNVSSLFKATHDLDLSYRNFGFFSRVLYFYDDAVTRKSNLPAETHKRLDNDAQLLDFFVRGQFDLGGRNLNARLGNQVVSWGESTFIPNGINAINPVDVARLRAPGSELKEGFLPQEMLWASQELSDNVSVEGFYQFKFKKTRLDPRGSFFSTTDILSPGGDTAYVGFGRSNDQHVMSTTPFGAPRFINRDSDKDPSDRGQFGLAARILAPALNDTEFGIYAMQYHSRTPLASAFYGAAGTTPNTTASPNVPGVVASTASNPTAAPAQTNARYFAEFPEDIRLYGLSASTAGPLGTAIQGEYSYRPNQPVQIAPIELLLAALGQGDTMSGFTPTASTPNGTYVQGYRRVKMHQFQATVTKSIPQVMGASQLVTVAEAGYTFLDIPSDVLFAGPGASLPFANNLANTDKQTTGGYTTRNSYGIRLVARAEYPNAIAGINLTPRIAYSRDIKGVSPTFNAGTQAVNLGITGTLRQNWQADLSYTAFFGGRTFSGTTGAGGGAFAGQSYATTANALKDRDFIAATVSYSF